MEVVEVTTATAPRVSREILKDRWHSAVTTFTRTKEPDGRDSTTLDNTEAYYAWEDAVVMIAARLRGDHLSPDEQADAEEIAAGIWEDVLKARMIEWAEERAR